MASGDGRVSSSLERLAGTSSYSGERTIGPVESIVVVKDGRWSSIWDEVVDMLLEV